MSDTRTCHLCATVVGSQENCPTCTAAFEHRRDAATMSVEERALEFEAWCGVLEIDFGLVHKRLEELAGRPVWTHELAHPEEIVAEIRAQQPATFADVVSKATRHGAKPIIVTTD